MSSAAEHYAQLLAHHYTWMFGVSFEDKVAEQQAVFVKVFTTANLTPHGSAIDLGSGPGFQSFALSRLGFTSVLAVDTSKELLDELESHHTVESIHPALADIRELPDLAAPGKAAAIVCMGDTLTHLPAKIDVVNLIAAVFKALVPGGVFVITWRDLSRDLTGTDRFIPVRSDADTIMTCFLDYSAPGVVTVNDLIYHRQPNGWSFHASSYIKLRLSSQWLAEELTAAGFTLSLQEPVGRLLLLSAIKP